MSKMNLEALSSKELLIYIEECAKKGDDTEMMRAHRILLIKEGEDPDDFSYIDPELKGVKPSENKLSKTYIKLALTLVAVVIFDIATDIHFNKPVTFMRVIIWCIPPLGVGYLLLKDHISFTRITKRKK